MKLDRNITNPRRGKYALIKLRETNLTPEIVAAGMAHCDLVEVKASAIDFGDSEATDFFVIRLKDKYAFEALRAYARTAAEDGQMEYAKEIVELAEKSRNHPNRKMPD